MSSRTYYATQEALTTYAKGQGFGDPLRQNTPMPDSGFDPGLLGDKAGDAADAGGFDAGAVFDAGAKIIDSLFGSLGKGKRERQQQAANEELTKLNQETLRIQGKTATTLANIEEKRTTAMLAYGVGGVIALGLIGAFTVVLIKRSE